MKTDLYFLGHFIKLPKRGPEPETRASGTAPGTGRAGSLKLNLTPDARGVVAKRVGSLVFGRAAVNKHELPRSST